jgi:carboxyl-terminal processing protease
MKEPNRNTNRTWMVWGPLLLALALAIGLAIGMQLQTQGPYLAFSADDLAASNARGYGKLEELFRYIDAKYVDSVDREALLQSAIDHVLLQLDPHSSYLSSERVQSEMEKLEGNFDGIGIEFMVLDDTIRVIAPTPGGPADKAGVLGGDNIITIEDSLVAGVKLESTEIMRLLRGPRASEVRIGFLRYGETELRQLTLIRDKINVESLDAAYMIRPAIGYVRINRFSATTAPEFNTAMKKLVEEEGLKDLILDLRQNPGGYLRAATEILSQFFTERSKLLVYTEGRTSQRQEYETSGRALVPIRNVVVLIDEGSASASEILAGALQDNDRALIAGRRSYGKGLVQEQYPLSDGSAVRLTVARYYIPSGRSIQKPYDPRLALLGLDTLPASPDTTAVFYTRSGRKVFGGGGIEPDVVIPLDSAYLLPAFNALQAHIPAYAFLRLNKFRELYQGLSFEVFRKQFKADEALLDDLLAFAQEKGSKATRAEALAVKDAVLLSLKSRLARELYGSKASFIVMNDGDSEVQKAIELIAMKLK